MSNRRVLCFKGTKVSIEHWALGSRKRHWRNYMNTHSQVQNSSHPCDTIGPSCWEKKHVKWFWKKSLISLVNVPILGVAYMAHMFQHSGTSRSFRISLTLIEGCAWLRLVAPLGQHWSIKYQICNMFFRCFQKCVIQVFVEQIISNYNPFAVLRCSGLWICEVASVLSVLVAGKGSQHELVFFVSNWVVWKPISSRHPQPKWVYAN